VGLVQPPGLSPDDGGGHLRVLERHPRQGHSTPSSFESVGSSRAGRSCSDRPPNPPSTPAAPHPQSTPSDRCPCLRPRAPPARRPEPHSPGATWPREFPPRIIHHPMPHPERGLTHPLLGGQASRKRTSAPRSAAGARHHSDRRPCQPSGRRCSPHRRSLEAQSGHQATPRNRATSIGYERIDSRSGATNRRLSRPALLPSAATQIPKPSLARQRPSTLNPKRGP
jgi:hypothetical protein